MDDKQKELREMLENVVGSYDDFVGFVLRQVRDSAEKTDRITDYIKDNPNAHMMMCWSTCMTKS